MATKRKAKSEPVRCGYTRSIVRHLSHPDPENIGYETAKEAQESGLVGDRLVRIAMEWEEVPPHDPIHISVNGLYRTLNRRKVFIYGENPKETLYRYDAIVFFDKYQAKTSYSESGVLEHGKTSDLDIVEPWTE